MAILRFVQLTCHSSTVSEQLSIRSGANTTAPTREQGLSSHVFMTERDGPMTPKAFHALVGRIGERAKMPFPVHPHMLRHGCGYALANGGHDTRALQAWLGHKNIQHTARYTEPMLITTCARPLRPLRLRVVSTMGQPSRITSISKATARPYSPTPARWAWRV
jgi:integrase